MPDKKLAVIGFCFGGGLTWRLLAAGEPQLAAAVPFYGPLPDDPDFAGSKQAAVLGFYGALDTRVTSSKDAAQAALDKAGLVNELVVEARRRPCVLQRHRAALRPRRPPPMRGSGCRTGSAEHLG